MNLKNEFEQFLAVKANEFVASKTSMSIVELRELNAVLDSFEIDFTKLPKYITMPPVKNVRFYSAVTNDDIEAFVLKSMSDNTSILMSDLYESYRSYFGDKLTDGDFFKATPTSQSRIKARIWKTVDTLKKDGKISETRNTAGKKLYMRKPQSESKKTLPFL